MDGSGGSKEAWECVCKVWLENVESEAEDDL